MSVLTPSVPERAAMLAEAERSVQAQRGVSWEHLVLVDESYLGCARTVNRLAEEARGEWLLILADDDLLLPGCLQAHVKAARNGEIVYSPPEVQGEDEGCFHGEPPTIPSLSLIPLAHWRLLGGYRAELSQREDRQFYEDALVRGVEFKRIEGPLWVYRLGHGNKSRGHNFGTGLG